MTNKKRFYKKLSVTLLSLAVVLSGCAKEEPVSERASGQLAQVAADIRLNIANNQFKEANLKLRDFRSIVSSNEGITLSRKNDLLTAADNLQKVLDVDLKKLEPKPTPTPVAPPEIDQPLPAPAPTITILVSPSPAPVSPAPKPPAQTPPPVPTPTPSPSVVPSPTVVPEPLPSTSPAPEVSPSPLEEVPQTDANANTNTNTNANSSPSPVLKIGN